MFVQPTRYLCIVWRCHPQTNTGATGAVGACFSFEADSTVWVTNMFWENGFHKISAWCFEVSLTSEIYFGIVVSIFAVVIMDSGKAHAWRLWKLELNRTVSGSKIIICCIVSGRENSSTSSIRFTFMWVKNADFQREIGRAKSRDQTGPKVGARLQTPVFFGARASADVPNVDPILDVNSHLLFLPYKLSFS